MTPIKVIHFPDNRKANEYQNLLLQGLKEIGFDVGYGRRKVYFSVIDISLLLSAIGKDKCDVVHLHWLHPFLLHKKQRYTIVRSLFFVLELLFLKILGVKIVWTVHNLKNHDNKFVVLEKFFSRIIAILSDALIAHCEISRDQIVQFFQINKNKVFVVPHGNYINVYRDILTRQQARERFNLKDTDIVFLCLGAIRPYKGIDDLVKSFQKIDDSSLKLIIAGRLFNQEHGDELKNLVADNKNILMKLQFIENDEIEIYMKAADVMVLPYRDIVNSGSVILGMSYGKVIIAPRMGCIPEIMGNGGDLLYDPTDKDALFSTMKLALKSKNKFADMGETNLKLAEKMDWKEIAASTGRIYVKYSGG